MSARSKAGQDFKKIGKVDRTFPVRSSGHASADAPTRQHLDDIAEANITVTIQVGGAWHRHTGRITRIAAGQPFVVVEDTITITVHHQSDGVAGRAMVTTAVVPSGRFNKSGIDMVCPARHRANGFTREHPTPGSAIDFDRGHQFNAALNSRQPMT